MAESRRAAGVIVIDVQIVIVDSRGKAHHPCVARVASEFEPILVGINSRSPNRRHRSRESGTTAGDEGAPYPLPLEEIVSFVRFRIHVRGIGGMAQRMS